MKDRTENNFSAEAHKGHRRGRGSVVALGCLVAMAAIVYITISICVWIDNIKPEETDGFVPAMGAAGEDNAGEDAGNADSADGGSDDVNRIDIDENGNVVGVASNSVVYSQEELEDHMASAREQAVADVLDSIRTGLTEGDTVLQTLRPLYPEDLIVYSGGKYHFVPINRQLKQNQLDQACLNILETGEYQYIQDGVVISHKGIDVSRHQGSIDWQLVAQDGVEFAFIRVGYRGYGTGKMVEDEYFESNIKGAIAAGIKVGVYYYSQAVTEEEALEEANFVLGKIAPYQIDCPVVFDVEMVTGADGRMNNITVEERTNVTVRFCETIKAAGYRPMVYYNTEMGAVLLGIEELEDYDKWFASYSDVLYYPYAYDVWQYSATGSVQGIKGDVDLNISFIPLWQD